MKINTTNMWDIAAVYGLALGVVSSTYSFITLWMGKMESGSILISLLTFILWTAKLLGCIWIMRSAMKKYCQSNKEADNKGSFRTGVITAIMSALVFAAVSFANMAYISADYINQQMEKTFTELAPLMNSNSLNMVDEVLQNIPEITFFSNLAYCSIYGIVLSAILSHNIPSRDPFSE